MSRVTELPIADPVGDADAFATETLVRFSPCAWTYQAPARAPEINPLPAGDDRPVTFGCFNNLAKINDTTLALWARVLAAVPGSRLLCKGWNLDEEGPRQKCLARFAAAGSRGHYSYMPLANSIGGACVAPSPTPTVPVLQVQISFTSRPA